MSKLLSLAKGARSLVRPTTRGTRFFTALAIVVVLFNVSMVEGFFKNSALPSRSSGWSSLHLQTPSFYQVTYIPDSKDAFPAWDLFTRFICVARPPCCGSCRSKQGADMASTEATSSLHPKAKEVLDWW